MLFSYLWDMPQKKKEQKKRSDKYEEKVKIDGTLEDVLKISTDYDKKNDKKN